MKMVVRKSAVLKESEMKNRLALCRKINRGVGFPWYSGESALISHQYGPGSILACCHMWAE